MRKPSLLQRLADEGEMKEIELDQLRAAYKEICARLRFAQQLIYEELSGTMEHENDDCPEDDTCECENIARLNKVMEGFKP